MDEEIRKAIELLESYIECKSLEIKRLKSLIVEAKGDNPIIDKGYFRIVEYKGGSKYIQVGKVYKGSTFYDDRRRKVGRIGSKAFFTENNTSWVIASKEEYINQKNNEE